MPTRPITFRCARLCAGLGMVGVILLGGCEYFHAREVKDNAAPGFNVNCADWHKTERGTWVSDAKGTMFYPKKQGMLANTELSPADTPGSTSDLWAFVEASCAAHAAP